jgi:hypothetical protein
MPSLGEEPTGVTMSIHWVFYVIGYIFMIGVVAKAKANRDDLETLDEFMDEPGPTFQALFWPMTIIIMFGIWAGNNLGKSKSRD